MRKLLILMCILATIPLASCKEMTPEDQQAEVAKWVLDHNATNPVLQDYFEDCLWVDQKGVDTCLHEIYHAFPQYHN